MLAVLHQAAKPPLHGREVVIMKAPQALQQFVQG